MTNCLEIYLVLESLLKTPKTFLWCNTFLGLWLSIIEDNKCENECFHQKMFMVSIKVTFNGKKCLMEYSGNFTGSSQCRNVSEHQYYCSYCGKGEGGMFLFVAPHNYPCVGITSFPELSQCYLLEHQACVF